MQSLHLLIKTYCLSFLNFELIHQQQFLKLTVFLGFFCFIFCFFVWVDYRRMCKGAKMIQGRSFQMSFVDTQYHPHPLKLPLVPQEREVWKLQYQNPLDIKLQFHSVRRADVHSCGDIKEWQCYHAAVSRCMGLG